MRLNGLDHADDHIVKTLGKIFHVLHFHGGHGQVIGKFL